MPFRPSSQNLKSILKSNQESNNKEDCGSGKSINSIKKLSVHCEERSNLIPLRTSPKYWQIASSFPAGRR